jgi:phosphate transport system substrate-binding protein
MKDKLLLCGALLLLLAGCQSGPRYSTTEGKAVFAVDESLAPVLHEIARDFEKSYPGAAIEIRTLPARGAVVAFAADSIRRMVLGRELNDEERTALARGEFELTENHVALDAAAVIGHASNPLRDLRMGQLDSMLSGALTRWPEAAGGGVVALTLGDMDGSVNEVVKDLVLRGKAFAEYAEYVTSSAELVDRVRGNPRALGIVGLGWLRGRETDLRVFALGTPGARPDTTQPFGRFYTPVQAHVYRKYYPLTRRVMIYSREVVPEVGYGFISYVASAAGQRIFLSSGLVPATMPVRLVELTSKEVNKR